MEIWKDVKGYEGKYQVSNLGRVKSLDRITVNKNSYDCRFKGRVIKPQTDAYGYQTLSLSNGSDKSKKVHQLVAIAFLNHKPCDHKLVVNHINFNKGDNAVVNLELVTQRENSNQKHLNSSSKFTGVNWHKTHKVWQANIKINDKTKYLGGFANEIDAHHAYQRALLQL